MRGNREQRTRGDELVIHHFCPMDFNLSSLVTVNRSINNETCLPINDLDENYDVRRETGEEVNSCQL